MKERFIKEIQRLTGVSLEYAGAAWHTLTDFDKSLPEGSAKMYQIRFFPKKVR